MNATRLLVASALLTGACSSPSTDAAAPTVSVKGDGAPPGGSASAGAADAVNKACDGILTKNKQLDDAARAAFKEAQKKGDIHSDWQLQSPWAGECVRTKDGAWAALLVEVNYGGTHDVTWLAAHIDASGAVTQAPENARFNYVRFSLEPSADGASAVFETVSETPDDDYTQKVRYLWDGKAVRAEAAK